MEKQKADYFKQKYSQLEFEELNDLVGRRDTLADEAQIALDEVIRSKGMDPVLFAQAVALAQREAPPVEFGQRILNSVKWEMWPLVCTAGAVFTHGFLYASGVQFLGGAIPAMAFAALGWYLGTKIRGTKKNVE